MKSKLFYMSLVAVLLFSMLVPTHLQSVVAQVPEHETNSLPELENCLPGQTCQDDEGNWYLRSDLNSETKSLDEVKSIGGPDAFGYTWDNSVAYSWIDAISGGTEVAISDWSDKAGPITLPFDFNFYEKTYSEIYITGSGYLTFQEGNVSSYPNIPNPTEPNNIISPLSMRWDYDTGKVYYKAGENASGRYFVVEWSELQTSKTQPSTFQTILYENGDIFFQFKNINLFFFNGNIQAWYGVISGIEDSSGEDGLLFSDMAYDFPDQSAVKYTRPDPSARVKITPSIQGQFTKSGEENQFNLKITNIGDFGNDLFNMEVLSSWSAILLDASTLDPLVDTDSDGIMDTGILAPGESLELIIQTTTPTNLPPGTNNSITLKAISDLDINVIKTAKIDLTVPAPFAQIYDNGEINIDLVFPQGQSKIDVTSGSVFGNPIVAETPDNNFISIWPESSKVGDTFTTNLYYKIVEKFGNTVKPRSLLTTPTSDEFDEDNGTPVVSVAPNGNIMIAWEKMITNYDMNISCHSIWYSILNSNGSIITGPNNLTERICATRFWIWLRPAAITASANNNFMISWDKSRYSSSGYLEEVLYSIIQSNGAIVKPPTKINEGVVGSLEYFSSYVSSINDDQFLLTNGKRQKQGTDWVYGNYFQVLNSMGQIIKSETEIPYFSGSSLISKQLSGGNILLATSVGYNRKGFVSYLLLNNTDFSTISSNSISHPFQSGYIQGLSLTRDKNNHGILTWSDEDYKNLFYTLIDGNGSVITDPIIFRSAGLHENLYINYRGGSNTTNSWEPEPNVDGLVNLSSTIYGVAPGGSAGIEVFYANQGVKTATNVLLSLSLDDGLTYDYDTSSIAPSISGNTVEWELPDLELLENNRFMVYLSIPEDSPLGTQYSASFTLSTEGIDSNPSNSSIDAILFVGKQIFLPLLFK